MMEQTYRPDRPGIAILASGSGTTAEAFIHATYTGAVDAEVQLVIASKPDAGIFNKIKRLNMRYDSDIQALHISNLTHPDRPGRQGEQTLAESAAIRDEIAKRNIALVALMGYMKKVRGPLLEDYGSLPDHKLIFEARMVNTHPGPLPETRGLAGIGAQKKVLELGLDHSAQTLHVVTEEYDAGAIYAERRVPVIPGDTAESLFEAVQATEKAYLPSDIGSFLVAQQKYRAGEFPPPRIS